MQPVYYRGVPVRNLGRANRLTIPGSLRDVARYKFVQALNQGDAIASVQTAIERYTQKATSNPYSVGLAGLGDDTPAMFNYWGGSKPPTKTSGSDSSGSTGWMDVAKTFVGNISAGIAAKIGGYPVPTGGYPAGYTPPAPSIPWVPLAALGVGGVVIYKMLGKSRRRA